MDVIRSAYRTKMKLWKNRDTLTPVYWFRCEPDAKNFGLRTSFGSHKTWCRDLEEDDLCGERLSNYSYYNAANPVGYDGQRHCGADLAMQFGGVTPRDPDLVTDGNGSLPCCFVTPPPPPPLPACVEWSVGQQPVGLPPALILQFTLFAIPITCVLIRAGWSPFTDPDPTPAENQTGVPFDFPCYWVYMCPDTQYGENATYKFLIAFALLFRSREPTLSPGCDLNGCGPLLWMYRFVRIEKATGIRSVFWREYSGLVGVTALADPPFVMSFIYTQPAPAPIPTGTPFVCHT